MVIQERKNLVKFLFLFLFFKTSRYAYFGGFWGGGGWVSQVGKAPQKNALLLPKSFKFWFHFGDELQLCMIDYIDYYQWGALLCCAALALSICLLHCTQCTINSFNRLNVVWKVFCHVKNMGNNYFLAHIVLQFGQGASGSIWWLLFVPRGCFP